MSLSIVVRYCLSCYQKCAILSPLNARILKELLTRSPEETRQNVLKRALKI